MNLSLERFYRQFRETDRKVSALIGDLQSGAIPLYIATPQSEGGEGAIAQIRSTLGNIANILRDPYIILKTEMSVVRAERASALSPRGIQETVQDGRVWKKKNNDVLPEYVYAIEREDDYNTYENRMVKSLIDKAVRFLNVPMKNAKDGIPSLYEAYFQISNLNKLDWMKIMEKDIFQQNPERAFDQYSELYRLKSRLNVFRNSPFYRTMSQFPPVSGSLEMTNLLTHNEDYRRCAKLWTYLDEANAGIFTLNEQQRANAYSLFIFSGLLKAYADGGFTLAKDGTIRYLRGFYKIPPTTVENELFTVELRAEDTEIVLFIRPKTVKQEKVAKIKLVTDYDLVPERGVQFYVSLCPTPYSDNAACVIPNNLNSIKDLTAIANCTVLTFPADREIYRRYCLVCGCNDLVEKDGALVCNDCEAKYTYLTPDTIWLHHFHILQ